MMKKSHSRERHGDTVFVTALYNNVVAYGTARLRNIRNTAFMSALDVIVEREKRVGAQRHPRYAGKIFLYLFVGQRLGTGLEILLPNAVRADVLFVSVDVSVDYIVTVGAFDAARRVQ